MVIYLYKTYTEALNLFLKFISHVRQWQLYDHKKILAKIVPRPSRVGDRNLK